MIAQKHYMKKREHV